MHPLRAIISILTSIGGATTWAIVDGLLGTLAALIAVVAGLLGIFWGWKSHRAKMKTMRLDQERQALEIRQLEAEMGGEV